MAKPTDVEFKFTISPLKAKSVNLQKEWKADASIVLDDPAVARLQESSRWLLMSKASVQASSLCRKAWEEAGHSIDDSTLEEWKAHVTTFMAEPFSPELLAGNRRKEVDGSAAAAEKQITAIVEKQEAAVIKLYKSGLDIQRISSALGVTPGYASSILERRGVLKGQK